jgi:hypothetical protein
MSFFHSFNYDAEGRIGDREVYLLKVLNKTSNIGF